MHKRLGDQPLICQNCQSVIHDGRDLGIYLRNELIVMGRHHLNELKVVCRTCHLGKTENEIVYNIDL
jgi:hypothetical protein